MKVVLSIWEKNFFSYIYTYMISMVSTNEMTLSTKGSLQKEKNWIFYDIELISIATYPPYLIMT